MARSRQLPSYRHPAGAAKRLAVFERDGFACIECGLQFKAPDTYDGSYALGTEVRVRTKSKLRMLTVDHIVPRSRQGSNDLSNLQSLCTGCNSSKGAR